MLYIAATNDLCYVCIATPGGTSSEEQEGSETASNEVAVYVITGLFMVVAVANIITVLFLVVWHSKHVDSMGMLHYRQKLIADSECDTCELPRYEMSVNRNKNTFTDQ